MATHQVPTWCIALALVGTRYEGSPLSSIRINLGYELTLSPDAECADNRQVVLAATRVLLTAPELSDECTETLQDLCLLIERDRPFERITTFFLGKYGDRVTSDLLHRPSYHRALRDMAHDGYGPDTPFDAHTRDAKLCSFAQTWVVLAERAKIVPQQHPKKVQFICDLWFPPG